MPSTQFMLCTDLDGTVLGDAEGEARFREWAQKVRGRVALAYVTGRNIDSVKSMIANGQLPEADFISTDVGTKVWDPHDSQNRLAWHYVNLADGAWPAQRIRDLCQSSATPLQHDQAQGRFKASFHWDGQAESLQAFRLRLNWLQDQRLIITAGQYLDVLPSCYGKGQAVRFLAAAAGVELKRTIVAGDMENDLDMFSLGAQGIVPSNALPALKQALAGGDAYFSALPAAWGLLDGLQRLGLS